MARSLARSPAGLTARSSCIRDSGSPGARRMRTNISTTAIANVTTACAIRRTSHAVKSGPGGAPAPQRDPRRFGADRHIAEPAVHRVGERLSVHEGGGRAVLDPAEERVPQRAIRFGARDRALQQGVRARGRSSVPRCRDRRSDQLNTRPLGEGSWMAAEKSMSKSPAERRSAHTATSSRTSSTRTPTWRSCSWMITAICVRVLAGGGHQHAGARAARRSGSPGCRRRPGPTSRVLPAAAARPTGPGGE